MRKYIDVMMLVVGAAWMFSGCTVCRACAGHLHLISVVGPSQCSGAGQGNEKPGGAIKIEKSIPQEMIAGKPLQYTITATNLCGCTLEAVVVTEKFAGKIEGRSVSPDVAKITAEEVLWKIGSMKAHEVKILTVKGVTKSAEPFTTVTQATYDPAACRDPQPARPELKFALEAPAKSVLCDVIPVTFKITNAGNRMAKNVTITQALAKDLTTADNRIALLERVGNIAAGASRSLIINFKAQKAGRYVHQAAVTASDDVFATPVPVTTDVLEPSLKVGMEGSEKVFVGKNADYKISIQNAGTADAAGTIAVMSFPASMKFVSAASGGKISGSTVNWEVGTLGVNKQISLSATLRAVKAGPSESEVAVKGRCCKEVSAKAKTEVTGIAAARLEVLDAEDPIQVGEIEKFTVTVTNQGSAPDKNVSILVHLEDNFDYVSSTGPTQGKAEDLKEIEFAPLASLEPGQKISWEVRAKAVSEGDHRTTVTMKCDATKRAVQEEESTRVY